MAARDGDGAGDQGEFKLKLMGINRTLDPWKLYQDWAQTVEKRTNGRVQFELTSLPELGLGGAETLRVLRTGVVDVTETYGGYVAGEHNLLNRAPRRGPSSGDETEFRHVEINLKGVA